MPINKIHINPKLIEQFRQGNEIAFEVIFHRTKEKMNGFLHKSLPKNEDVDSVLQEIYLKLWSSRKSIKSDKNFEVYLFAIAKNMVIDVMRKRFNIQKYREKLYQQLKMENDHNMNPLENIEYKELEHKIFHLIEKLPKQRRKIFKLNRIDGMTYREIAIKLNISENTVDTQIRKAIAFLRSEIKNILSVMLLSTF